MYLNTQKAPFDNPNVRKAISQAINREQIVKVAMYDYTHPADATGMSYSGETWKDQAALDGGTWTKFDAAKANELLDAAGLKKGQIAGKAEFEAARERLMATGAFESVGYRFQPSAGGKGYAASFQVVEVAQVS